MEIYFSPFGSQKPLDEMELMLIRECCLIYGAIRFWSLPADMGWVTATPRNRYYYGGSRFEALCNARYADR